MLQNPSQEGSPAYTASRYFANQYVKPSNLKTSKTNLHASLMSATHFPLLLISREPLLQPTA